MKLTINDSKTIMQIQDEFNSMFPYLKIEVFSHPHEMGAASEKKHMVEKTKTLKECRTIHNNGSLKLVPDMTVAELEKNFQTMYGLSVQVFRRSGKVWLETINTDRWTLDQHNELGEFTVKGHSEIKNG